jgi:2-dehydropantoate 2-reductase
LWVPVLWAVISAVAWLKTDAMSRFLRAPAGLTLHPAVIMPGQIAGAYDLILLGVKSYSLARAMDDFGPAVGSGTMILPVLNGIRHMDLLADRFGQSSVLGGVCRVATEIDEEGKILQLADFQSPTYGEIDGARTSPLETVDAELRGAGFDASVSAHVVQDMWQKWVQLAALGAINCLMRGNIGQIAALPGGSEFCLSMLHECADIAKACGYPQPDPFLEQHKIDLTTKGSLMTSSMYRSEERSALERIQSWAICSVGDRSTG